MKQILASLLAAYTLTNGQTTTSSPGATATAATTSSLVLIPPVIPPVPPVVATPAPVTPAPVTPAPVTPAPVTPAPVTPSPTTGAPTTAAPTYNPYCPMPAALTQQHGVQSGTAMSSNQGCISPYERAVAFNGILQCSSFACCQCAEIQCGDPFGLACDELVISDSGAVGNQNINVLGDMTSAFGGNSFAGIGGAMNNGAEIRCNGLEACKAARIYGKYVGQLKCSGDMGCAGANIRLEDPGNELQVQCNGMMSCMNTNLEIVVTAQSQVMELGTIEFNGQQSAQGMTITIINQGLNPLYLHNLECMNPTACPNLRINIVGQLFIENCDLQHMNIQTAGPSLLAACQAGAANQGNIPFGFPGSQPQIPQIPQVPQGPATNPGSFNPQQQAPAVPTPVQPQPPATQPQANPGFGGFGGFVQNPQVLECKFPGECTNRAITMTPAQNFQLKCQMARYCDNMQLTLNTFGFGSYIDHFTFSAPTNGVTITVNGAVEINDIRCEVLGACTNLRINGQGIDLWNLNMDCQQPGACNGCTVNGMDCNMLSMQQGNNAGFGFQGNFNPYIGAPQQPQYNPYAPPQQFYPPQWI